MVKSVWSHFFKSLSPLFLRKPGESGPITYEQHAAVTGSPS